MAKVRLFELILSRSFNLEWFGPFGFILIYYSKMPISPLRGRKLNFLFPAVPPGDNVSRQPENIIELFLGQDTF